MGRYSELITTDNKQSDQLTPEPYLKRLGWFVFFLALLSVEGAILFFLGSLGGIDDGSTYGAVATASAYFIVIITFLIWGSIIVFRKSTKDRITHLNHIAFGGGMAMILLSFIIYPIWVGESMQLAQENNIVHFLCDGGNGGYIDVLKDPDLLPENQNVTYVKYEKDTPFPSQTPIIRIIIAEIFPDNPSEYVAINNKEALPISYKDFIEINPGNQDYTSKLSSCKTYSGKSFTQIYTPATARTTSSTPSVAIVDVSGFQAEYTPGQQIAFTVEGVQLPGGAPSDNSNGLTAVAAIYKSRGSSAEDFTGSYDAKTGLWAFTFAAPSSTDGYWMSLDLSCINSSCEKEYPGVDPKSQDTFEWWVVSSTPQDSSTSSRS